jgi:hypothetical protein
MFGEHAPIMDKLLKGKKGKAIPVTGSEGR